MDLNHEETDNILLPEFRVQLIGERLSGKSWSGNTLLRKERFECGRTRTLQAEVGHGVVDGWKLIVVDAPGWNGSLSLDEIPEQDKQKFQINPSKCPPGPNAFLLAIPIDTAFTMEQKRSVEDNMMLLGERAWQYTLVLFTCGDYLGEKTVEQHIKSEGKALKWLIQKCRNRYHVFNNKENSNSAQVSQLLVKIDEMVRHNHGTYYQIDEHTFKSIKEKRQEVAKMAEKRRRRAKEERQQMKTLIQEEMIPIPTLQLILLGSRNVGKTSVGNTIFGSKEQEDGTRTVCSVVRRGFVNKTEITLVDTPGWWKGFPVLDTPEVIKEEVMGSMFLYPPGPHVFLLVIDADSSFNGKHLEAVMTHMELLGERVWTHTIVVFTRGDWLGTHTIEEYIEGEGEALQSLVDLCGNRYHVLNNKNSNDDTQVTELLEKITLTVAANDGDCFVPDEKIRVNIEEKRKRVEERASLRQSQVRDRRQSFRGLRKQLQELTVVLLGQKSVGKSASGNILLGKEVFAPCANKQCQVATGQVADRVVTVIDSPGWWKTSAPCNEEMDREIVRGMSLSPSGVHAVLLVIPLDLAFREAHQVILEEHMNLFDASVWKHTMVLFTYRDKLAGRSVEEHIEREHSTLRWLIDKCENRYHAINNTKTNDMSQVKELLEKIEEMVAENKGSLFCPDMNDVHLRIEEKFRRKQLKTVLKQRLEQEYRRRELELMINFRSTLLQLRTDMGETVPSTKSKCLFVDITKSKGLRKKDEKEERIVAKLSCEIEKLDKEIMRATDLLRSSKDFLLPDLEGESPAPSVSGSLSDTKHPTSNFEKVLGWLSNLHISKNVENQLTLNFSQSSGYRSVLSYDFDREEDF
ncbi:GTPase IMAP family member 8 [Parambassis ranga]|uniref:GTPase IMAP family member 8 n=1 Tax=Parambassis ranga TaxID=210632 RepID=A0A6P7IK56_9TELE|nr:GTPase IMAP family member 8-like [Parambassis ranga]